MNCEQCFYKDDKWNDGGFCYMFKEKHHNKPCSQFKDKSKPRSVKPINTNTLFVALILALNHE